MKPNKYLSLISLCLGLLALTPTTKAAVLTYNPGQNLGWFDTSNTQWGTGGGYNLNWSSGNSATINQGTVTIAYNGNTSVENLTTLATGAKTLSGTTASSMTFSGGTVSVTGGNLVVSNNVNLQGNFTKAGSGALANEGSTGKSAYVGTATINAGTIYYNNAAQLGASSNFVISGGILLARQNALSAGSVVLNSGTLNFGRTADDTNSASLTVTSFSGSGGTVRVESNTANTTLRGLTVNQATNTNFAGNIEGVLATTGTTQRLQLTKSGTGNLSLSGTVTLGSLTTVSNGGLFINGNTTDFSNGTNTSATTAISVTGGTLGGTGIITVTDGDNIVLGANGKLAAGLEASAGRTTYGLGAGALDLSTATASSNTGWLKFELGGDGTAGTTYDQILLSSGVLNVGSSLNFSDFSFTELAGFGNGTYVLFQTSNTILGSLGITEGTIGTYDATLSFSGNNLVLEVVPEPSSVTLIALGAVGIGWMIRRKKARRHIGS